MLPHHLLRCALEHHLAALAPSLGTDVHDVVGGKHHVLVVLHHYHRVAYVTEVAQRGYQFFVVALVQTDARLIEYVEHVHKLRAYLCGKPYALALAARQCCRGTVERQVVEPHLQQEVKSCAYLLQYLCRYLLLLRVKMLLRLVGPAAQLADVHFGKLAYVLVPYSVRQSLAVEALAAAFRTGAFGKKLLAPLSGIGTVIVVDNVLYVFHHSVEGRKPVVGGVCQFLVNLYVAYCAVKYLRHCLLGNLLDGSLQRAVVVVQNGVYLPEYHLVLVFSQWQDASGIYALLAVGHHLVHVNLVYAP